MPMTVQQIEEEARQLEREDQAKLLERLLTSFTASTDWDDEIANSWLDEAKRRAESVESGQEETYPADEVLAEAYARLRRR